jgi:hypothetical protein
MQRRTLQLRYAAVVTSFIMTMTALMAILALSAVSHTSGTKVLAHGLSAPLTSTTLLINEVFDSSDARNEYVELVNVSSVPISLTSYSLYNKDTSPIGIRPLYTITQQIQPGQHLAIGPAQLGTSTLVGDGLDGAGDYLALVNTPVDQPPVDLVNWGSVPNPSWNGYSTFYDDFFYQDRPLMPAPDGPNSLSRYPDRVDTDSGLDWRSLPQSPGFANMLVTATPTPGTPTPSGACEDRYESDNTLTTAKELLQNSEQVHILCRATGEKDRDWVFFGAAAGKIYTMLTKDLAAPVDTIITLYNASGDVLAESDDYPGLGLASRIDYVFSADGTYYMQIRDKRANGGPGYQYTVSLLSTGQVPGTVTTTPTPTFDPNRPTATATPGICFDTYETDGLPRDAKLLNIGTTQSHSFCPFGDVDWVRFFAKAGKAYTLRTAELAPGVDTYMFLFNGDASVIIAQNDDAPDGGLASRIDFYPLRDDWYLAQIKNSGEIGAPSMDYDIALAVVPGVPEPPYSATPVIPPPPAQNTNTPGRATPTLPVTRPPLPTPTQGGSLPTPTPRPTTQAMRGAQSDASPDDSLQQDVQPFTAGAGEIDASSGQMPNMPLTGLIDQSTASKIQASLAQSQQAPMLMRIFYDRNRNDKYDKLEGVRGLHVYFLNRDAGLTPTGQIVTSDIGTGNLMLPIVPQRIYVPYLGINVDLTKFPEREAHSLWLPSVTLPDRIP